MEKMPQHPRLYKRGNVYYHRASIPEDIKDTYPKTEETFSLKTRDPKEAVKLVRAAAVEVDTKFALHRKSISYKSSEVNTQQATHNLTEADYKLVEEIIQYRMLALDEYARTSQFEGSGRKLSSEVHRGYYRQKAFTLLPPETKKHAATEIANYFNSVLENGCLLASNKPSSKLEEYTALIAEDIEELKKYYSEGGYRLIDVNESLAICNELKWRLHGDRQQVQKVIRAVVVGQLKALQAIQKRNNGQVIDTPKNPLGSPKQKQVTLGGSSNLPAFSTIVKQCAIDKVRENTWTEKTRDEYLAWAKHFIDYAGDKPIDSYKKADARGFKDLLFSLPTSWTLRKELKGLSITEAAKKAKTLHLNHLAHKNINKIMLFVGSFFTWADKQQDQVISNPFSGLQIPLKESSREDREPFTNKELQVFFNGPVYTGCQSIRKRTKTGNIIPKDSGYYWVPLIALYTGARQGEILQLQVSDVRREEGVWYFNINDEGNKRLKNKHSKRVIPIHSYLIMLGLLDFVDSKKYSANHRLFDDIKPDTNGSNDNYSKAFRKQLEALGIKHPKNNFHRTHTVSMGSNKQAAPSFQKAA